MAAEEAAASRLESLRKLRFRWPDVTWTESDLPIAIVDGRLLHVRDLTGPLEGEAAHVVGLKDDSLARVCEHLRVRTLNIYSARVGSLEPLGKCTMLRELCVTWCTKATEVGFLAELPSLEVLILSDLPKVRDLGPLSTLKRLEALELSGGIWSTLKIVTLKPLVELPVLRELALFNLRVERDGLRPLARCSTLEDLDVSNQFETSDYAFLSIQLPRTRCGRFSPWTRIAHPIEGKDTMVTGRRKPFLDSSKDRQRIDGYERAFDRLRASFQRELGQHSGRAPHA